MRMELQSARNVVKNEELQSARNEELQSARKEELQSARNVELQSGRNMESPVCWSYYRN